MRRRKCDPIKTLIRQKQLAGPKWFDEWRFDNGRKRQRMATSQRSSRTYRIQIRVGFDWISLDRPLSGVSIKDRQMVIAAIPTTERPDDSCYTFTACYRLLSLRLSVFHSKLLILIWTISIIRAFSDWHSLSLSLFCALASWKRVSALGTPRKLLLIKSFHYGNQPCKLGGNLSLLNWKFFGCQN